MGGYVCEGDVIYTSRFQGGIDLESPPYNVGRVGEGIGQGSKLNRLCEGAFQKPLLNSFML